MEAPERVDIVKEVLAAAVTTGHPAHLAGYEYGLQDRCRETLTLLIGQPARPLSPLSRPGCPQPGCRGRSSDRWPVGRSSVGCCGRRRPPTRSTRWWSPPASTHTTIRWPWKRRECPASRCTAGRWMTYSAVSSALLPAWNTTARRSAQSCG